MSTRSTQGDPEPPEPAPPAHNVAARMARWSAHHRKTAIFGWLVIVLAVFMAGQAIGTNQISDVDKFSGESHEAEQALDRAGPAAVERGRLPRRARAHGQRSRVPRSRSRTSPARLVEVQYVENVESPLTGDGDGVGRRPRRARRLRDRRRLARGERTASTRRSPPSRRSRPTHPALESSSSATPAPTRRSTRVISDDLAKAGELSLPITLIILIITFGTLVAAGVPLLIGITSVMAALGARRDHEPRSSRSTATCSAVILLIGLAVGVDYSLFYLRREREERAAGRRRARCAARPPPRPRVAPC